MDLFLKILLGLLLFFAPFSFGAAEPWAFSVLQGGIVLALFLLLCSRRTVWVTPLLKPVFFTLGFLTFYALLQSLFPQTLLEKPAWYPSTLMRLYTLEHASLFVTYLALAFLVSQLADSFQSIRRTALLITLCGLAVALCAVSLQKGEYIHFFTGVRGGFGPFLNRNHAGVFLAMSALITLGSLAASWLERRKFFASGKTNEFYLRQASFSLVFLGLCAAVIATRSRGAMLSLGAGLFCYAFLCWLFIPKNSKTRLKGLLATGVLAGICAAIIYLNIDEINAFSGRTLGVSVETRQMLYRAAFSLLTQYPLWGIGIGALPVAVTSYMDWPLSQYVERLHGDWLEILLGTGYIGAIPVLFGLVAFIWIALKRMGRLEPQKQLTFAALLSALAVMSTGSAVDFHFFIPATAFLFFLTLGLACSPSYAKGRARAYYVSAAGRLAAALVCTAACIIPTQKTTAWRLAVFGRGLKAEGKIAAYQRALSHYPGPRFALRLGNAYYNQSFRAQTPQEAARLRRAANTLAAEYLQKYPKEKELSVLYMRSRLSEDSKVNS